MNGRPCVFVKGVLAFPTHKTSFGGVDITLSAFNVNVDLQKNTRVWRTDNTRGKRMVPESSRLTRDGGSDSASSIGGIFPVEFYCRLGDFGDYLQVKYHSLGVVGKHCCQHRQRRLIRNKGEKRFDGRSLTKPPTAIVCNPTCKMTETSTKSAIRSRADRQSCSSSEPHQPLGMPDLDVSHLSASRNGRPAVFGGCVGYCLLRCRYRTTDTRRSR